MEICLKKIQQEFSLGHHLEGSEVSGIGQEKLSCGTVAIMGLANPTESSGAFQSCLQSR